MAKPKIKTNVERFENQYLDVELPKFESFQFTLTQTTSTHINSKTEEVVKTINDFHISVNISNLLKSEDKELSLKVKEATRMNFAPYYWSEKSYKYYTTERTGTEEEKKEILKNIFQAFSTYEKEKKEQMQESLEVFNKDKSSPTVMSTQDLFMKYSESLEKFVVIATDFIGSEKYGFLRKNSLYSSKLCLPQDVLPNNENQFLLSTEFFKEDLPNKKLDNKTYFVIDPNGYEEIKLMFQKEALALENFVQKQKEISATHDLSQYDVEVDNDFGLRIKFNPQTQYFEFYGKGYFEPERFVMISAGQQTSIPPTPRNAIAMWALNFLYTQPKRNQEYGHHDILNDNKEKIELDFLKGGTKKEKNLRVPAQEWEKIKAIKENFEQEQKLWGREEKSLRITHCELNVPSIISRYPAIYYDAKGQPFLIKGTKRSGFFKELAMQTLQTVIPEPMDGEKKKRREPKYSITLKGIPLSFEEANDMMTNHEFAMQIKANTTRLNGYIWSNHEYPETHLTENQIIEVFDKVMVHANIQNQNKVSGVKQKKLKI